MHVSTPAGPLLWLVHHIYFLPFFPDQSKLEASSLMCGERIQGCRRLYLLLAPQGREVGSWLFKPLKCHSFCVLVENSEVQWENRFFWLISLKMDASLDRGKPGTVRNVSRQEGPGGDACNGDTEHSIVLLNPQALMIVGSPPG